jgi:hypothetical protein
VECHRAAVVAIAVGSFSNPNFWVVADLNVNLDLNRLDLPTRDAADVYGARIARLELADGCLGFDGVRLCGRSYST